MSITYQKMVPLAWYGPGWRCYNKRFIIDESSEIPEFLFHHIIDDGGTMFDNPDHNAQAYTSK